MPGDYQELVDEISALLGAPATLENRDFGLIAFGAHDSDGDLDPAALTRSYPLDPHPAFHAAVRSWFEGFGITRATGPVRIPPTPEAGVFRGRICLPVRHRGIVLGYVGCWTRSRARPTGSWRRRWRSRRGSARCSPTRRGAAPTSPGVRARC